MKQIVNLLKHVKKFLIQNRIKEMTEDILLFPYCSNLR